MSEFIKQKDGYLYDLSMLRKRYYTRLIEIIDNYGIDGYFVIDENDYERVVKEGMLIDMLLHIHPIKPVRIRKDDRNEIFVVFKNHSKVEDETSISLLPTETQAFLYRYIVDTLNRTGIDYQPIV